MAFLGFHSLDDIDWMTISEYLLRLEAYQLSRLEAQEDIAMQAWMNQAVQATTGKKKPKPKYKKFKQFFDRDEMEAKIKASFEGEATAESEELTRGRILTKRMHEFQRLKKAGKIVGLNKRGGKK